MVSQYTFPFGRHTVKLEVGLLARQATAAVRLEMDDTVILATVVAAHEAKPGQDVLPLTVDYLEKTYAAGRIPGNALRREGALSEKEVLTARLIDRAIRPLFPAGFTNEVHVVIQVLSLDPQVDPDIPALLATSAALRISGIPFPGTLGAVRVGYKDGLYILNPCPDELAQSKLNLVVAGTELGVLMVEAEACQLSEETMLNAIVFGHGKIQQTIDAIDHLAANAQRGHFRWQPAKNDLALEERITALARPALDNAYRIGDPTLRRDVIQTLRTMVVTTVAEDETLTSDTKQIQQAFSTLERTVLRERILNGKRRIDGRDIETVRPIAMRTGVLPRAHGSALFTRGDTQSLAVVTLGELREAQIINALQGRQRDRLMLHYNMPPFATGEAGRVGPPKRREIGHGRLAKRAIASVLPGEDEFPYTIRVVSEITESNGSSSMATVCGACLALLDAGVPLKEYVAGVAMGLIVEGSRFAVLTDILGDEDHLGDMDFKVAGTARGITALQMDVKVHGVSLTILQVALARAREARLHILQEMRPCIDAARPGMSSHAPRVLTMKIDPARIRDVIGIGGAMIRAVTQETGASIDIQDDGTVTITSHDLASAEAAKHRINILSADIEVGKEYQGVVRKVSDFGTIVAISPGREGWLHVSQICEEDVASVADVIAEGQAVRVKVLESDDQGRIRLSMTAVHHHSAAEGV
jgi:polyribonucleotide nucleotidyltransferase